jgi:DivIVA domain-containing protein
MESKTTAPSFTVSLRGYDRMEVDEYLDSLAEAMGQVEVAEDRNRGLQAHIEQLTARIADLEERIRSDVPRTGAVLGERISLILRAAEEAATDTINRAEAAAAEMTEKAREEVAQAEDQARGAIVRGEEQARRIESSARAEAAEIIAEAESRASARTRQIEQWAEQVVSHTRAEEARMLAEQQDKRERGEAELRALAAQRDAVAATIGALREQLGQALGLVGTGQALTVAAAAIGSEMTTPGQETAAAADGSAPVPIDGSDDPADAGDPADSDVAADIVHVHDQDADDPSGAGPAVDDAVTEDGGPHDGTQTGAFDAEALESGAFGAEAFGAETFDDADADAADDEMPWPAAFRPVDEPETEAEAEADDRAGARADDPADADATGEIELRGGDGAEKDDFDMKFDAWVSQAGGPRHFKRL